MDSIIDAIPILAPVLGVCKEKAFCECSKKYNVFDIRIKESKKVRTIESPCAHLKMVQRALLDRILVHVKAHDAAMAFVRGKSISMNARRHHGAPCLFTTDVRSFFPSITTAHVNTMLEKHFRHLSSAAIQEIIDIAMWDSRLPQGAPTSPILANLVMYDFDERCHWFSEKLGAVYTRYADDISISAADANILFHLESIVREGLRSLGMEMHPNKTRHYGPDQRKTVTGLDIGGPRIRPTRAFRKKATALVRMTAKYPEKMLRHRGRICGYLAFWFDVDPDDSDLFVLLNAMGLQNWAHRCAPIANGEIRHPPYWASSLGILGNPDDELPF